MFAGYLVEQAKKASVPARLRNSDVRLGQARFLRRASKPAPARPAPIRRILLGSGTAMAAPA
jgi:hypothetical protein